MNKSYICKVLLNVVFFYPFKRRSIALKLYQPKNKIMQTKKLLKKLLALCCLLLSINGALAQTQNPSFSFPPFYDKMQPSPHSPPYSLPAAYFSYYSDNAVHNLIADGNGNPLFFIVNGTVYDSSGNYVDVLNYNKQIALYCTGLPDVCSGTPGTYNSYLLVAGAQFNAISGYTEVCLVQNPANCKQYYIFTSGQTQTNGAANYSLSGQNNGTYGDYQIRNGQFYPFYAVLDLSLTNINGTPGVLQTFAETNDSLTGGYYVSGCTYSPYGSPFASKATVTDYYNVKNLTPLLYPNVTPFTASTFYASTPVIHGSGGNYNLIFHSDGYHVSVMKLTGTGSTPLTLLRHDSIASSQTRQTGVGEMEVVRLSNKNFRVAVTYLESSSGFPAVYLADYDSTGTPVSGSSSLIKLSNTSSNIHGIELTPSGADILISHDSTSNDPNNLYYVALSTPLSGVVTPSTSNKVSGSPSGIGLSQIELNYQSTTPYMYFTNGTKVSDLNVSGSPPWSTWNTSAATFPSSYSTASWVNTYILPDQIDGGYYNGSTGGPSQSLSCCLFYSGYDKVVYNATNTYTGGSNQTWRGNSNPLNGGAGSTVTIGEELRIPAGMTVTIDSMTIKFSPQARLIIENGTASLNGGKLVLNNCTLKVDNRCISDMWPGVQVWGTPANTHGFAYQGSIFLNNSQIQDAYNAVCVGYNNYWYSSITPNPGAPTINPANLSLGLGLNSYPGGGGIIQATSTTFLNNYLGVAVYIYTNSAYPNNNIITECAFTINAALLASGVTPSYHILLETNTEGFYVVGSSFTDTHYLYNDYGIYAYNSNFSVGDYYGSAPRSTFTNMLYGIYALNSSGNTATMSCTRSMFVNNSVGTYLGHVNGAIIETDTFKIRRVSGNTSGLYLDNCTGYYVQDNYFNQYNTASGSKPYGIVVNNSGAYANAVFRNTFTNLYKGSQAQYRNYVGTWQSGNGTGLLYLCNTFINHTISYADIYVPALKGSSQNVGATYTGVDTASGIGNSQGNITPTGGNRTTAGNQFSHSSAARDFYIETSSLIPLPVFGSTYRYYASPGDCADASSAYYPVTVNNLALTCKSDSSTPPSCLSGPDGHTARTMQINPVTQALSDAATAKQLRDRLNALLDGGSTNGLLNLVNGNNNSSVVFNSLNSAAPYLSNAVLKAYVNSNYPASDISQILTACSPLSNQVNSAITSSNLSAGIKSQITALQTGDAKIDELTENIETAFTAYHFRLDDAIRILIRTSAPDSIAMAKALMKEKAMELPARVQVETGLDINDSIMATNALRQVANAEGQSNYVKLSTILLNNLNKEPQSLLKDQSILHQVQAMAIDSSDRLNYLKANILLSAIKLSHYQPYYQENDPNNMQAAERTEQVQQIAAPVISLSSLYNSPNPFKESTTVKAVIVEKTQNAFVVITDMVGNEVARYPVQQGENNINVSAGNLNQAVMFCTLVVDGVKIKTNKMVLIK
jgi:hypothetical protein